MMNDNQNDPSPILQIIILEDERITGNSNYTLDNLISYRKYKV